MLQWLNLFLFLGLICLISIFYLNIYLISLLLIGEIIVIIIFLSGLLLASYFNIVYLIGFSFFLLAVGGLELALNFILMAI